jgi:hypothetical protein
MNSRSVEAVDPRMDSFIVKYCQRHRCLPEDFAVKVLWQCMRPFQSPIARVIWVFNADFFHSDLELIRQVKDATTYAKVREIIRFFSKEPSFLRRVLKVRISRAKLLALAAAELGESKEMKQGVPPA